MKNRARKMCEGMQVCSIHIDFDSLFYVYPCLTSRPQLELPSSNTVKVDYRLPVTCSDFNSTTVNSLGLDFIDLLPVTLSISYRFLNVVSNTDFYAICSHYYHFSNRIVTNIILL